MILGVTGMPGSGKTEVKKVAEEFGIPSLRMGDILIAEAKRRNIDINNSEAIRDFVLQWRKEEGMDVVAKGCMGWIKENMEKKGIVLMDNIMNPEEIERFKNEFQEEFKLIAVWSSPKTRYSRILSRKGREDKEKTLEECKSRDKKELKLKAELITMADYLIINEGSLEELHQNCKNLLQEILKKFKSLKGGI